MLVSRISPAPRSAPSRAHWTASLPVATRPPFTYTSNPSPLRFASIASTTHWAPNVSASSFISSGRATAAELTETLSAPASSTACASARADAAADRERDEHVVGRPPRELHDRLTLLVRRRDVEEHELVRTLGVVTLRQLDRVPGVAQPDEVGALDHAALVHVEARDHAL